MSAEAFKCNAEIIIAKPSSDQVQYSVKCKGCYLDTIFSVSNETAIDDMVNLKFNLCRNLRNSNTT